MLSTPNNSQIKPFISEDFTSPLMKEDILRPVGQGNHNYSYDFPTDSENKGQSQENSQE